MSLCDVSKVRFGSEKKKESRDAFARVIRDASDNDLDFKTRT